MHYRALRAYRQVSAGRQSLRGSDRRKAMATIRLARLFQGVGWKEKNKNKRNAGLPDVAVEQIGQPRRRFEKEDGRKGQGYCPIQRTTPMT